MKIAVCLHGQPRRFQEGYSNIIEYIKQYPDISFDIFYHTWHKEPLPGETLYYNTSKYRNISLEETKIQPNLPSILQDLYKPVAFIVEEPKTFTDAYITDSIWYKISSPAFQNNCSNAISLQYSRQQVRNLLETYIEQTQIEYDFVIASRFDVLNRLRINFYTLDATKCYSNNCHRPRCILNDYMTITNVKTFLCVHNVFANLHNIINNIESKLLQYGESQILNSEQLFFENYLYYFETVENVVYTEDIPSFYIVE